MQRALRMSLKGRLRGHVGLEEVPGVTMGLHFQEEVLEKVESFSFVPHGWEEYGGLKCQSQSQNENTTAKSRTQQQITEHNRKKENRSAKQKHKCKKKNTPTNRWNTTTKMLNSWLGKCTVWLSKMNKKVFFFFLRLCFSVYRCGFVLGSCFPMCDCVLWFVVFYFVQLCLSFCECDLHFRAAVGKRLVTPHKNINTDHE